MVRPRNPNKRKMVPYHAQFYVEDITQIRNMAKTLNMPVSNLMVNSTKVYGKKLIERAKRDGLC